MAVAWAFFLIALFPSYVSVFVVEKYYTSFWTGFWNLYGLILTTVGLAFDGYNPWWVWGLFALLFVICLLILGFLVLIEAGDFDLARRTQGWLVRHLGASWLVTSLDWGLYFGFTSGPIWGVVALIGHGVLMLLLILAIAAA